MENHIQNIHVLIFNIVLYLIVRYIYITWNNHKVLKCKYELYALRDELREKGYNNEIDVNSRGFMFLDLLISNLLQDTRNINLWVVLLKAVSSKENKNNPIMATVQAQIDGNDLLKEISFKVNRKIIRIIRLKSVTIFMVLMLFYVGSKFVSLVFNVHSWYKTIMKELDKIIQLSNSYEYKKALS